MKVGENIAAHLYGEDTFLDLLVQHKVTGELGEQAKPCARLVVYDNILAGGIDLLDLIPVGDFTEDERNRLEELASSIEIIVKFGVRSLQTLLWFFQSDFGPPALQ